MLSSFRDTAYQVCLPVFEGPLDLLLQLIEREKLDISVISLAQVAAEFLTYVRDLDDVQADTLADFLEVAARLVWIKSRLLLPKPKGIAEEEEEDPGEALARQLREYKRFKEVALALRRIEETGCHTYPRKAPPPELERHLVESDLNMADLIAAAQRAFSSLDLVAPMPPGVVRPFTLTINDQIRMIRRATSGGETVVFRALLRNARHRLEIIVTLLAVLELVKRNRLRVAQSELFGDIVLQPMDGAEIDDEEASNGDT